MWTTNQKLALTLSALLSLASLGGAAPPSVLATEPPSPPTTMDANSEANQLYTDTIQPLLSRRCGKCHGTDSQKGELDLSSLDAIARGGESGEPLLAASLDDSILWTYVESKEMPPEGEPPLTADELTQLKTWLNSAGPASAAKPIMHHDILPIVLLRCVSCHGARLQRGGVDLRSVESMMAGGANGPVLTPGASSQSKMIQRIESEACPPQDQLLKYFVRRPARAEVDKLRAWIEAGAPIDPTSPDVATDSPDPLVTDRDRNHWAFQPPRQPKEGESLDFFIRRKLLEVGLDFAPPASRETLIRRAHIDLLGMPPTTEELQRWTASSDEQWYEQMIDTLLRLPTLWRTMGTLLARHCRLRGLRGRRLSRSTASCRLEVPRLRDSVLQC